MLLTLMAFTVVVIIAAWEELDPLTLTMYILLTLSLGLTYTRRQAIERLSEFQMMIVTLASFVTIGMAGALLLFDAYRRYIA